MLSHLPIEIFGKRQKRGIQEGEVNCIKYDLLYRFQYTDIEGISYKIFFFYLICTLKICPVGHSVNFIL